MLRRVFFASLGFLATSGLASAETLDGRWSYFAADCASELTDSILVIDSTTNTLRYWESECVVTQLFPVGTFEATWQMDMTCSGEGDQWDRSAIFAIDRPEGGDTVRLIEIDLADGYVVSRTWCGPATPANRK